MSEFKPGWAEAAGKAMASKDEKERSAAMGLKPRRCFRLDDRRTQTSRVRGAHAPKRHLDKLLGKVDDE